MALYIYLGGLSFSQRGRSLVALLTAAPLSVHPPNMSFSPRCAAGRDDTGGGSQGTVGGQVRRAKQGQQRVWT